MTTWGHQQGVVELPDGRRIRGMGVRKRRGDVTPPNFGVLLLAKEPHVAWPRERVEIACGRGNRQTGTPERGTSQSPGDWDVP